MRRILCAAALICGLGAPARSAEAYSDDLTARAAQRRLWDDPYWKRLLHIRRDILGWRQSEIDDPAFFLAANGRRDPEAELRATLQAFFDPPAADESVRQHPQCRYPARYAWLKSELTFDPQRLREQPCPRYQAWRDQMDPGSVSLIFASAYLNNPASIYGHTFLRLNKRGIGIQEQVPLLDYTVNYAAEVTNYNAVLYVIYGLTGGYRGRFSTTPYYVKVQEYNNLESRDLWEYDLSLPPDALGRLLPHLWELGQTSMPYYFFNRNCSYQLMPLLEVADPSWSLSRRFGIKTVPSDTLRAVLDDPGRVSHIRRRSSQVSLLLAARKTLNAAEVRQVESLARGAEPEADLQAPVLDAALALLRYRHGFRPDRPLDQKEQEARLLALRNAVNLSSPPKIVVGGGDDGTQAPHLGHKTSRLGLGYGFSNRSRFTEFSWRPAVHDLDDRAKGYLPHSQLQMFSARIRYEPEHGRWALQELTLVDLVSLSPLDRWVRHPSWRIRTGAETALDLNRDTGHMLYYGLEAGSGGSFQLPGPWSGILYAMAEGDFGLGAPFRNGYRFGGGGAGGIALSPLSFWNLRFEGRHRHYPVGHPGGVTGLKLVNAFAIARNAQLRNTLERRSSYKEALFTVLYYF